MNHQQFMGQLVALKQKVNELKVNRVKETEELTKQKKQFLNHYKHILPKEERKRLIREINDEMK